MSLPPVTAKIAGNHCLVFTWAWGIQTVVFTLCWQVFYPLIYGASSTPTPNSLRQGFVCPRVAYVFLYSCQWTWALDFPVSLPGMNLSAHFYEVHLHTRKATELYSPDCWVLRNIKLANPLFQDAGHVFAQVPKIPVKEKRVISHLWSQEREASMRESVRGKKTQFPCSLKFSASLTAN